MSTMKAITLLLMAMLSSTWAGRAKAQDGPPLSLDSAPIVLVLCYGSSSSPSIGDWSKPLETIISRLQGLYKGLEHGVTIGGASETFCPNLDETACIVDELTPKMIYCNGEVLSRSVQAAAYMSAGAAVALLADPGADPNTALRLPISAFNAYDTVYASRFLHADRQALAMFR